MYPFYGVNSILNTWMFSFHKAFSVHEYANISVAEVRHINKNRLKMEIRVYIIIFSLLSWQHKYDAEKLVYMCQDQFSIMSVILISIQLVDFYF